MKQGSLHIFQQYAAESVASATSKGKKTELCTLYLTADQDDGYYYILACPSFDYGETGTLVNYSIQNKQTNKQRLAS